MFGLLASGHRVLDTPYVPNSGTEADLILTRIYPSKSAKLELRTEDKSLIPRA
jgi:hypothetical protein